MSVSEVIALASELIKIRSLSGQESGITDFLARALANQGWPVERLPVCDGRENLFVAFGTPEIVFTTHMDVVPAPDELFEPRVNENKLFGRGACDTKGIIATMIAVAKSLRAQGQDNFGLLFVVGEEDDGVGARVASQQLTERGIKFIINGEPTECTIMRAHKGALGIVLSCTGVACHSGYPEEGIDANRTLLAILSELLAMSLPVDPVLGPTTLNIGLIKAGVAPNIVSPRADAHVLFRTVASNTELLTAITDLVATRGSIEVTYDMPVASLREIADLPSGVASYCTDIPFFAPLGAECVLYGPGSILVAHTNEEHIALSQIKEALAGYEHIFHALRGRA